MILGFDHVQICIPKGRLEEALAFYVGLLGFSRVPKPASLDPTGAWLVAAGFNLHLSEEPDFTTNGEAHPALRVVDVDELINAAQAQGLTHRYHSGPDGFRRASIFDPFGNRIELMQRLDG